MIKEISEVTYPFKIRIVGKANLNEWNGMITPQILIEDYEIQQNIGVAAMSDSFQV